LQPVPSLNRSKKCKKWPTNGKQLSTRVMQPPLPNDDAVVFPPGGDMVKGRPAIEAFWTEAAKSMQIANFKVTDVRPLGPNAAREQGYVLAKTRGDNPQEILGKYVVVWEKVDGKSKLDSDIWNLNK
jgi:ketosteroid isomerase-like protein